MLVLGIETATPRGGAALWEDGEALANVENDGAVSHSQRLMPAIDRALRDTGRSLGDLDGIAVSIGPGSFTGLRIGISVAKTLAHYANKPVVAVPTLLGLAAKFSRPGTLLAPMLDARRSEIFGAVFRADDDGQLERLTADLVEAPGAFITRLIAPCVAGGSGALRYAHELADRLGERIELVEGEANHPSAAVIAGLGARALAEGATANVLTLEPSYVRKSDAELSAARRLSRS